MFSFISNIRINLIIGVHKLKEVRKLGKSFSENLSVKC